MRLAYQSPCARNERPNAPCTKQVRLSLSWYQYIDPDSNRNKPNAQTSRARPLPFESLQKQRNRPLAPSPHHHPRLANGPITTPASTFTLSKVQARHAPTRGRAVTMHQCSCTLCALVHFVFLCTCTLVWSSTDPHKQRDMKTLQ